MRIVHCVATGTDTPLNITWATSVEQHDVEVREYRSKQKAVVPKIVTELLWEDLCFFCVLELPVPTLYPQFLSLA